MALLFNRSRPDLLPGELPPPRDYAEFARRMAIRRKRLIAASVDCAPLEKGHLAD